MFIHFIHYTGGVSAACFHVPSLFSWESRVQAPNKQQWKSSNRGRKWLRFESIHLSDSRGKIRMLYLLYFLGNLCLNTLFMFRKREQKDLRILTPHAEVPLPRNLSMSWQKSRLMFCSSIYLSVMNTSSSIAIPLRCLSFFYVVLTVSIFTVTSCLFLFAYG